jgi:hypothetical protein
MHRYDPDTSAPTWISMCMSNQPFNQKIGMDLCFGCQNEDINTGLLDPSPWPRSGLLSL